jgi:hypothetical protein
VGKHTKKAKSYVKSKGLGYWMRRARLGADALGGALGVALDGSGDVLRAKASRIMQRYVGVGLDGSLNLDAALNNGLGLGTAVADDWVKRKTNHYQLIGSRHALPTLGESVPYLLSWDALGIEGTAREKAAAAYDCFVESTSGYVPSSGDYPGITSPKLQAYLIGSHGGRVASKVISKFFPGMQKAVRDLSGWSA